MNIVDDMIWIEPGSKELRLYKKRKTFKIWTCKHPDLRRFALRALKHFAIQNVYYRTKYIEAFYKGGLYSRCYRRTQSERTKKQVAEYYF